MTISFILCLLLFTSCQLLTTSCYGYTYTVSTLKPQQYLLVLGFYLYKGTIKVIPIS